MIEYQIAVNIAMAYREVECAENLLVEVERAVKDKKQPDIRDAFGRRQRGLTLGVPSGENGHRLLDVSYDLAVPILYAHIANKRAQIAAWSQAAIAQGMAAPSGGETGTGSTEGNSPVGNADAPETPESNHG